MNADTPIPARRREALGAAFTALALVACGGGGGGGGGSSSASAANDAALAGLSLSVAGLSPAFDSATLSYTLQVSNATGTLTLTPTAADAAASIRVNGNLVASGGTTAAIALAIGTTTLSIVVTAADGSTTQTYSNARSN